MLADVDTTTPATEPGAVITAASRAIASARIKRGGDAYRRARANRKALAAAAAEAAPAAIAAATTETERDLISRIFDSIPQVLALSDIHSLADAREAADVDEKWGAWEAAREEVEGLCRQVMALAPETAADALRRVNLYRQMLAFTEAAAAGEGNDDIFAEDMQVMGESAIAALAALAQVKPPSTDAWDAARAAYEAAARESAAARIRSDAAEDELALAAPVPEALQLGPGRWYFREEHIERDVREPHPQNRRLTVDEAAEKLAILREFLPQHEAESRRLRVEELGQEYDAALSRQGHLAEALINTPAPSAEAAAFKLQVLIYEWHGADTVDGASELLTGTDPDTWAAVRVMQDLMRLAGSASPLLQAEPFDAAAFIARLEANPGCTVTRAGPRWESDAIYPKNLPGADDWRALTDWQKEAVKNAAAGLRAREEGKVD